jgi:hypothetical protein
MKRLSKYLLAVAGIAIIVVFSGWGFLVHRTVNQLAVYQLPEPLQPFFYENMEYLVKNAVRPDLRRSFDTSEAPKHYIDAEMYGDSAMWKMPQSWNKAVEKFSKDTLDEYGYVPYWITAMKEKLTNAFRKRNRDSILYYAADIGHYIGDAHVPLHTTENYDGQLTNQKGLHNLWEATVPELMIDQYQLYSKHKAKYLNDPAAAIWRTVRSSFVMLPNVFNQETEASKGFTDSTKYRKQIRNGREVKVYTSDFAKEYGKRLGKTVNQRLLQASNQIADFWYTSWVDGGKPDLNQLLKQPLSEEQKNAMKKEWKFYRKNQLMKNNLLLAKKIKDES